MDPALRNSAAHVFVDSLDHPVLDDADAYHLFRVLRLRDGSLVSVSDGRGGWCPAVVRAGSVTVDGPARAMEPPQVPAVAVAIPKGDRLDWMVQKLTEVGAGRIVLLDCEHSVVRWTPAKVPLAMARLARIARDASSQSRRVWLPVIEGPVPVVEAAATEGCVMADPDGDIAGAASMVLVGPEGGFSAAERALDVPRVALADTVLRVETAAIVAALRVRATPDR